MQNESLISLVQIWYKSLSIFLSKFPSILIIVLVAALTSHLALYPIANEVQELLKAGDSAASKMPLIQMLWILATMLLLILIQALLTASVIFTATDKSKDILPDLSGIWNLLRGRFLGFLTASILKTIAYGLSVKLLVPLGLFVATALSLVEIEVLIGGVGIIASLEKSFKAVKPFFLQMFLFVSIFYSIPMLFLSNIAYFAMLALYTINMLLIYFRHDSYSGAEVQNIT